MKYLLYFIALLTTLSLHGQPPASLVGTVRVSYFDGAGAPDYGVEYAYYKDDSLLVFLDFEERSENTYSWNSSTGMVTDTTFEESIAYTYNSPSSGSYVFDGDSSTGTFVSYDASWDLDYNGTPDGAQIDAGILPTYPHKQMGLAALDSSNFWLSNEGVSPSDLSLEFSAQQIDVISSGSSPWGIVNALWVTNSGEINSLSWDNDWTISVLMLNSVIVADGGTRTDSD
ncbi:hypothetical protein N9071_00730, partial [bacterium]|nr:hypothetical protein [bacterium]